MIATLERSADENKASGLAPSQFRPMGLLVVIAVFAAMSVLGTPRDAGGREREPAPAQATQTPIPPANLVPVSGDWRQSGQGYLRYCSSPSGPPGGLRVCVANRGSSAAGPFALAADNALSVVLARSQGLAVGEEICLPVGVVGAGQGIVVDALNAVDEVNEGDNWLPPMTIPTWTPGPICVPTTTPAAGTPTVAAGPLPDLAGDGRVWMDVSPWGCLRQGDPQIFHAELLVGNDGNADAGAFRVADEPNDRTLWAIAGLPVGAVLRRPADGIGAGSFRIDSDDAVLEQDETNNRFSIPVPSPPPPCTPGPTPTSRPRAELRLERAELRAMSFEESCTRGTPRLQLWARVANLGTGPAADIVLEADGHPTPTLLGSLKPGERKVILLDPPVSWVRVRPVPGESPDDNARRVLGISLTPPPTCGPETVTPTASTPTPVSPTPTLITATAGSPTPAGRGLWLPWVE